MALDVANAVGARWESEYIPDADSLYMRVHFTNLYEDGTMKPGAFRDIGDGMSTDWEKYSTAEDTRLRGKAPRANAVISMRVGEVREIPAQEVIHTPTQNNRAHTEVFGNKRGGDPEARLLLTRISSVIISYMPEA